MHEDNVLMEKVKNGDKSAYETLVLKHRAAAVYFACSFVGSVFVAEDIVQECFARVYINRMSYKFSFSFKTYLYSAVRNRCVDWLRQEKRRGTVSYESFDLPNAVTPESIFFDKESARDIYRCLNDLPEDYKTALYLFAVDGMKYADIARVMQKSIPQVKIILYRARKKLKVMWEGVDSDER